MTSSSHTASQPSSISPDFFNAVNTGVSQHIRQKLQAMDFEVVDLDLHNSSLTKTFRVYLTIKRAVNLKTLHLAEQILIEEIERKFAFRPHAFYWRYALTNGQADTSASNVALIESA